MAVQSITWQVVGMHCPHCDKAVERAVRELPGLENPRADYKTGTLTARWDSAVLPEKKIALALEDAGYTLKKKQTVRPWQVALRLLGLFLALLALFLLISLSPLRGILSSFPVAKAGMSLGALFTLGLMTSLHCIGMCGGINLAQSAASAQSGSKVTRANLEYNLGRLLSYTLVGALVGALGSVLRLSTQVQAGIQTVAALAMLVMAIRMLDIPGLRFASPVLTGKLRLRLLKGSRHTSFFVGLVNGLMPCGPLQAMQLFALSAGSWYMGALSMAMFCLGTIPLMLGFGFVSGKLNRRFAAPMRIISACLILLMGMSMLTNGLSLAGFSFSLPKAGETVQAQADILEDGVQLVTSELEWRGYPDITVKAGTPVRWTIHAQEGRITGCNNEMVIPALGLRIPLSEGDNVVEFTASSPGTIPYTCWMGMLRGTITVTE
ncbi:MAG: sulfite exporter TauE/SafE family protein [Clostridia bacterium]|nr:sulfite exporter TauE/SafE family protein [Clostridia bacterium]MBR1686844.1 sulfite exporter TauE/SafE family protein [Clostridia bacterium]